MSHPPHEDWDEHDVHGTASGTRFDDDVLGLRGVHDHDESLADDVLEPEEQLFRRRYGVRQQLLPAAMFVVGKVGFYTGGGSLYHNALRILNSILSGGHFMASYSTNEFRGGLKVLLDGDPCIILENEFVKPGKGQAFNRVKLRNLMTNRVWERTFKSGETLEAADVIDQDMEYLYTDGDMWYFMKTDGSFEQYAVEKKALGDSDKWLKEQVVYTVTLWNDNAISVSPPNFIELEVVETDPGLKGDTAQGGSKPATLSSGAVVRVPLFINQGEVLKIDTRSGDYVSRA